MAKFQSPLLGYNNNVRHRGRVFHIQTEDSGVNHPHIITHLFMDGGRILKSVKKSYAEHVGNDGMNDVVRGLMKEQHKAMIVALRDGQFDDVVDGKNPPAGRNAAPPAAGDAKPAAPAATPPAPIAPAPKKDEAPPLRAAGASAPAPLKEPESRAPATLDERRHTLSFADDPPLPPELEALLRDELPPLPPPTDPAETIIAKTADDAVPATTREHRSAQELTVDFDALEHDGTSEVSPIFQRGDLPPPPKNLFAKEPRTGAYSSVDADARRNDHDNAPSPPETPSADRGGRPAQARPTAAFGTPPRQPSPSIFGDDLVGDKSLDEVILSYLADDLDPPRQK